MPGRFITLALITCMWPFGVAVPCSKSVLQPAREQLTGLRVDPSSAALLGSRSFQSLRATARTTTGDLIDVTDDVTWSCSSHSVVVGKDNIARPAANGAAVVVAKYNNLQAHARLTVERFSETLPVSLANDIEPVLTHIGCNAGACHGQQSGQGGFRLSLHGFDPDFDRDQIVNADKGAHVDLKQPSRSLLLLKPTMQVGHGGGLRIKPGSSEYNLVLQWLREGAQGSAPVSATAPVNGVQAQLPLPDPILTAIEVSPAERVIQHTEQVQRLHVTAEYSDGSQRDVTPLAAYTSQDDSVVSVDSAGTVKSLRCGASSVMVCYGGKVQVASVVIPRPGPSAVCAVPPMGDYIDKLVNARLARLNIPASANSTDYEFLRRVYLDVVGALPTPAQIQQFTADARADRRSRLIDSLLASPAYVDYRTLHLCDLLRVNGQYLSEEGADTYYRWIHQEVAAKVPYDQFVRTLLTAQGSSFRSGPPNYFNVATDPQQLAEATAQTFLGVRVQCARCHNHPFEKWTQSDYYGLSAFFANVRRKGGAEFGETEIFSGRGGSVTDPHTNRSAPPTYLGGGKAVLAAHSDPRQALAAWLTSNQNLQFAEVAVNRIWADLTGRGIVDAVDDFRVSNPPSNPPLLKALAQDFIQHGFDTVYITRIILNSQAYQRSSQILPGNASDVANFSRAYPRRIQAEVLTDAVGQVIEKAERLGSYPEGWKAVQVRDSRIGNYFMEVFGRPKREILCACERSQGANLAQSLDLINSADLNGRIDAPGGRVGHLMRRYAAVNPAAANSSMVDNMYVAALTRYPRADEERNALAYINKSKDRRQALQDLLWALLNSQEFLFNH